MEKVDGTEEKIRGKEAKISDLAIAAAILGVVTLSLMLFMPLLCFVTGVLVPLSIVMGIVAWVRISKSGGKLTGISMAIGAIVITLISLVPGSFNVISHVRHSWEMRRRVTCGTNLKGLGIAIAVYANDYDKYPTPDRWCDLLVENGYAQEELFVCPSNKEVRCSYAMNPNVRPDSPEDMVLLFEAKGVGPELLNTQNNDGNYPAADSFIQGKLGCPVIKDRQCPYAINANAEPNTPEGMVLLSGAKDGWNRVGGSELLNMENHDGEGYNVLFNDIHSEFVKTEELGNLKWVDGQFEK